MSERSAIRREVLTLYAVSVAICILLFLSQYALPFIYQNSVALAAMVFIFLPLEVLRKRNIDAARFGIHYQQLWRNLGWGLLLALCVFPLYLAGHHLWQTTMFNAHFEPRRQSFHLFPRELDGWPRISRRDQGLFVWKTYDHAYFWLPQPQKQAATLRITGDREPGDFQAIVPVNGRFRTIRQPAITTKVEGATLIIRSSLVRFGGRVAIDRLDRLRIALDQAGEVESPVRIGGSRTLVSPPIDVQRRYAWLLYFILIQFALVAVPEELFYRGYVQSRLAQLDRRTWTVLGAEIGPSILYTSLLFALGHFLVDWNPARLAVFFPSLLFGWLRQRTGSIGAAVVFHALSNLISELSARCYLVKLS
ncbi:MAG: CPBP family intramembrane metalloprotease [Myxococcales bacterium]|nr:CPBP family intramembrane metalloprotease [Myxococcales bacterium]